MGISLSAFADKSATVEKTVEALEGKMTAEDDSIQVATLHTLVVTASERRSPGSASVIGRDAMSHLQPSSIADLLELLPGQMSKTPNFSNANGITLRETGGISATGTPTTLSQEYQITSLGTLFMVDGAPMSNDGAVQAIAGSESRGSTTNRGIDMRSISTDNIQSVEVIRGIPSAEYGNLTSGVVNIHRIYKSTPLSARFKADGFSKLASIGKGFEIGRHAVNADLGWLSANSDPRNTREGYKRLTGGVRSQLNFGTTSHISTRLTLAADYTGSYDRVKTDPDLSATKIDDYSSDYTQWSAQIASNHSFHNTRSLRNASLNASVRLTHEGIVQRRQVAPQRTSLAPTSMAEGEQSGRFLIGEYIADFKSDSKPLDLNIRANASGDLDILAGTHRYKAGIEMQYIRNLGEGQIYDLTKPINATWTTRPRRYADIPALMTLSAYAEDNVDWTLPSGRISLQAGVRALSMPTLSSAYTLSGKVYLDPRINLNWYFPLYETNATSLRGTLGLGYGIATRMPTADYLYPQQQYIDIIQLNAYNADNPIDGSLVSLRTYIADAVNHNLVAARNHKYELRAGLDYGQNRLILSGFYESMTSGFRYLTDYLPYSYRKYDASAVDLALGMNQLASLPYETCSVLRGVSRPSNSTRIDKTGIEYQLHTMRIPNLHTALTVSGAWLMTRYSNYGMIYDPVSAVVNQQSVSDRYVGLYLSDQGRINSQCNTNFTFDTQWPQYGMIFTTSLQCMWYIKTRRLPQNGIPYAYIDAYDGLLHNFTDADTSDPLLQHLVQTYNPLLYNTQKVPTAMYLNLRATKLIGDNLRVSAFVNSLLDYLPDYTSNGLLIRRSAEAYFGMEATITI